MDIFSNLGIDWNSVIVYVVNFGILVAIIAYFFTGPILKMIDERRDTIKNNLDEAERIKKHFMKEKEKSDAEKEELKAEVERELSDLNKEMADRRKKLEEELDQKKSKMLEDVRGIVEDEKGNILKNAEKEILILIEKVVLHIVSNKIPEASVRESVEDAWKTFNK